MTRKGTGRASQNQWIFQCFTWQPLFCLYYKRPDTKSSFKEPDLIFLSNKIRLNLINTFVMSRNKHISKKTPCLSHKRSKNTAKPNEFERCILKLSCYTCADNPKCWCAFNMFRNASNQNEFWFNTITNLLRCMTETTSCHATLIGDLKLHVTGWRRDLAPWSNSYRAAWLAVAFPNSATFCHTSRSDHRYLKPHFASQLTKWKLWY